MACFSEAVNESQLRDLGYVSQNFTWCHKFRERDWIRERLDKALVSTEWALCFPSHQLHHLASSSLEHCILLLKDTPPPQSKLQQRKKFFRFKSIWLQEESCTQVVKAAWARGMERALVFPFLSCLEECHFSLTTWTNSTFGHVRKKIAKLQWSLQELKRQKGTPRLLVEIKNTRRELNKMLDIKEAMWHQRMHISWLK